MAESYVQQRIKEIYDAYRDNEYTKDYKITLTPINGSGDIHVQLVKGILIPDKDVNTEIKRDKVIRREEPLDSIQYET